MKGHLKSSGIVKQASSETYFFKACLVIFLWENLKGGLTGVKFSSNLEEEKIFAKEKSKISFWSVQPFMVKKLLK